MLFYKSNYLINSKIDHLNEVNYFYLEINVSKQNNENVK